MKEFLKSIDADHTGEFRYIPTELGPVVPAWIPKRGEGIVFENDYCAFKPVGFVEVDGLWRPMAFKVVTDKMKSLGLRHNPNIMTFELGQWAGLADSDIVPGIKDNGGIWSAWRSSKIKDLREYMMMEHNQETRAFIIAIDNPLYANSYRIKSQGVYLLAEVTDIRNYLEILT